MATAAARGVFATFTRTDARSDADLLRRFAAGRDEGAFAELVRRHGPLVLGVCRRAVSDVHLADDAFQAVFVVLANRAVGLDAARPLGPWLYGVAYRVALRARTMIGRRRKRETLAAQVPDVPTTPPPTDDTAAILDEEISRLSAVCRDAVVLCELQGVSRKEAAKRLGVAEGTLSSRLAAARKTLAERLRKRGVALSVGIFSTTFVPTDLLASTVALSTGKLELSTQLVTLIEGATHMALLSKLKLAAVAAVFAVLSAGGVGVWRGSETTAAPVPKAEKDDGLIWTHNAKTGELTAYTPDGKKAKEWTLKDGKHFLGFTLDGKQILFAGKKGKLADDGDTDGLTLHLRGISDKTDGTDTGLGYQPNDQFVFSPDRKLIVRQRLDKVGGVGAQMKHEFSHVLFDAATKKETTIGVPTDHQIMRWADDGKTWRVLHSNCGDDPKLPNYRWLTAAVGDKPKLTPICDAGSFHWLEPDADGKTFLAVGVAHPATGGVATECLFRVAGDKAEELVRFDRVAFVSLRRSPDFKRMAVARYGWNPGGERDDETQLLVLDADGKNETKLFTVPNDGQQTRLLGWFPTHTDVRRKNAPVPKAAPPEGVIVVTSSHKEKLIELLRPDGTPIRPPTFEDDMQFLSSPRLSRDGKRLAVAGKPGGPGDGRKQDDSPFGKSNLYVSHTDSEGTKLKLLLSDLTMPRFVWSADGKRLYVSQLNVAGLKLRKPGDPMPHRVSEVNVSDGSETPLDLPGHEVIDLSPDGTTMSTQVNDGRKHDSYLVRLDTWKASELCADAYLPRFSPDGKRVLLGRTVDAQSSPRRHQHFVMDLGSKEEKPIELSDAAEWLIQQGACWSPDGKRVLVQCWQRKRPTAGKPFEHFHYRLTSCDPDGANAKTVLERESSVPITGFDWQVLAPPQPPDPRRKNAPVPKQRGEGVLLVVESGVPKLLDLGGRALDDRLKGSNVARLSADGKMVVGFETDVSKPNAKGQAVIRDRAREELHRFPLAFGESGVTCDFQWSADGGKLYIGNGSVMQFSHRVFDLKTKELTDVSVPVGFRIAGWSPDGKKLFAGNSGRVAFLSPDGKAEPEYLTVREDGVGDGKLSPDGTKVLYRAKVESKLPDAEYQLYVFDLKTRQKTRVTPTASEGVTDYYCWGPNGRVAYTWRPAFENPRVVTECEVKLITANTDGGEAKEITTRTFRGRLAAYDTVNFMLHDWR